MKPSPFHNKVVWITGASAGIGAALALAFARQGARLILSARSEAGLRQVAQACATAAENVWVLPLDLSRPADLEAKAEAAVRHWGGIDYLVHNAGIAARDLVQETGMDIYRAVMETNFFGPVALTRAVLPDLLRRGRGHLVVVSSLSGKYGVPRLAAYAASKHALHGFFDSLRAEVAGRGLKVTIVIPGFIRTAIIQKALNGQGRPRGTDLAVNAGGLTPEACAERILKAIRKGKAEALVGRSEVYSVYLHRFFPRLFAFLIRHHPIRKLRALFSRKR